MHSASERIGSEAESALASAGAAIRRVWTNGAQRWDLYASADVFASELLLASFDISGSSGDQQMPFLNTNAVTFRRSATTTPVRRTTRVSGTTAAG